MKKNFQKIIIIIAIGFACIFLSYNLASAITLNSIPFLDGIRIFPGGVCVNQAPAAGDNLNNRRFVARLVFDSNQICKAADYANPSLKFDVNLVDGTPFADLGNLIVRVQGGDLLAPCVSGGLFLTNVPGPGTIVIDNTCPNYWALNQAISNSFGFPNPALIVTLEFAVPSDMAGDRDLVVMPTPSASLDVTLY